MKNMKAFDESIKTLKASVALLLTLAVLFFVVEPAIGNAVEDTLTISQTITSEISFITPTSDVTMTPSLAGITGGTSFGSTTVSVLTNNNLGYNMTLTASSSVGMIGNGNGGNIPAYVPASGITPDFTFTNSPSNSAHFGYSVNASTTSDLSTAFLDNGSVCGSGAADAVGNCWINASTSARQIINRATATSASGATTTIVFRVSIPASPVPSITQDTYVATTTLTAVVN